MGALVVNSGSTMLFRIARTNLLRTYVNVPQSSAADIHVGQKAFLSTSEAPGTKFPGQVTRTSNSLDPSSRTLLVEIQAENSAGKLMPGMYGAVRLTMAPATGISQIWSFSSRSERKASAFPSGDQRGLCSDLLDAVHCRISRLVES